MINDPKITEYAKNHTTPESALLQQIVVDTLQMQGNQMLSGRLVGQLLYMLVRLSKAKRVLEMGTYSGYSALMMAEALPVEGELITIDASKDNAKVAQRNFDESPDGKKIELKIGKLNDLLPSLTGKFDLIFIDADKKTMIEYFEWAIKHLSAGGIIVIDNVLWKGLVLSSGTDAYAKAIVEFNDYVQQDKRVRNVVLPVGDGVMLVMKA